MLQHVSSIPYQFVIFVTLLDSAWRCCMLKFLIVVFCQWNAVPQSSATLKLLWYAVTARRSYASRREDVLDSPKVALLGERVIDDAVPCFFLLGRNCSLCFDHGYIYFSCTVSDLIMLSLLNRLYLALELSGFV